MQRKLLFNIYYLLFSAAFYVALSGCTLSMEDYVIEEEMSRGFDEPYTETTDVGTFTYQYQEGVRPITKKVLDYVLGVESDSIVYYVENCPPEWLPKVGGYVSCGCSRKIPNGLCNRVLSVQHQDGHYKVVTTKAKTDEVFKELDIELDFEYQAPNLTDSTLTDSLHLERKDSTIIDWAFVDGVAATRAFTPEPTRGEEGEKGEEGEGEKDKDKDVESEDKVKEVSTTTFPIKLDFVVPEGKLPKLAGLHLYVDGTYKSYVRKLVHYKAKKLNNYCESWDEDHSYEKFDVSFGLKYSGGEKISDVNLRKYKDALGDLFNESELKKPLECDLIPPIKLLIGAGPVSLILEITLKFNIDITVAGYGELSCTTYFPVKRTGKIEEDGHPDIKIDELVPDGPGYTKCKKISINGKLEITPSLTLDILVKHVSGVGVGFDVTLSGTFWAGVNGFQSPYDSKGCYVYDKNCTQLMNAPDESKDYRANFSVGFSLDLQVSVRFEYSPFGFKFLGIAVPFAKTNILNISYDFGVKFNQRLSKLKSYYVKESDNSIVLTPSYYLEDLGVGLDGFDPNIVPRLRFYDSKHKKCFDLVTKNYDGKEVMLKAKKEFEFQIPKKDVYRLLGEPSDGTYYIVPVYYDKSKNYTTVLADYEQVSGFSKPSLTIKSVKQMFANEVQYLKNPEAVLKRMSISPVNVDFWKGTTCYSFRTQVELANTAAIEKWGINIVVKKSKGFKEIGNFDCDVASRSFYQLIKRGLYTIRSEFLSDYSEWNFADNGKYNSDLYVFVTPYYYMNGKRHLTTPKKLSLEGILEGSEDLEDYENYRTMSFTDVK